MSSSACCSAHDANTYQCHWDCDHGFKCDLAVKADVQTRRKREFTPDELKDDNYWMKRSRNNEAAKRSRERRRMEERLLEERAVQLLRENEKLRAALSAIHYHRVGKEASYDTFVHHSSIRELARDSYLRSLVSSPGANRAPHYAHSSRYDFGPAYDSVPFPSFPAASFPALEHTYQTGRYLGIPAHGDGNVPFAVTRRKPGQGHPDPWMNLHPNSAPSALNETAPGYQCPTGTTSGCAARARVNETYTEQRAFVTEPRDRGKGTEMVRDPRRVSTSPLLPHKLRYKVQKPALSAERALSPPGISQ